MLLASLRAPSCCSGRVKRVCSWYGVVGSVWTGRPSSSACGTPAAHQTADSCVSKDLSATQKTLRFSNWPLYLDEKEVKRRAGDREAAAELHLQLRGRAPHLARDMVERAVRGEEGSRYDV